MSGGAAAAAVGATYTRAPSPTLFGESGARGGEESAKFKTGSRTAAEENARFVEEEDKPPYADGHHARVICLERERIFVRVHGKGNQVKEWLMRPEDIEGLTAEEIKNKFAIPKLPKYISEVHVPSGTYLRAGIAATQTEWGEGGAIQYEILSTLEKTWFSESIPIDRYRLSRKFSS